MSIIQLLSKENGLGGRGSYFVEKKLNIGAKKKDEVVIEEISPAQKKQQLERERKLHPYDYDETQKDIYKNIEIELDTLEDYDEQGGDGGNLIE